MKQREINDALIASPFFDRKLLKTYEVKSLDTVLQIGEVPETALIANTSFSRGVMVFTNRRLLFLNKTLRSLKLKIEEFVWPDLIHIDDISLFNTGKLRLTFINKKAIFIHISKSHTNTLETYLISKISADSIPLIQFGKSLISLPDFDRRLILTGEVKSLSTVLNDDETPELVLRAKFMSRDGIIVATDERFMFIHHRFGKALETDEFGYWDIASAKGKNNDLELHFVLTDSPVKFSGIAEDLIPRSIEFVNEKISRHRQKLYDTIAVLPDFDQELLLTPEIILLPTVLQEGETPEKIVRASIESTEGVLIATNRRLLFLFVKIEALKYYEFQWSKLRYVKHSGSGTLTLLFIIDEEARQFDEIEFLGISETLADRLETHLTSKMPAAIQKLYDTIAVLPDFDQELLLTPEIILLPTVLQEGETPEKVVRASRGNTEGVLIATDRRLMFMFYSMKAHRHQEFQWSKLRSVKHSGSGALMLFFFDEEAREFEEVEFIGISETFVDRLETHLMSKKMPVADQRIQKLYDTIAVLPDFDQELLLTPEIILLPLDLQEGETPEKVVRASRGNADGILVSTDRRLLFRFYSRKDRRYQYNEFQWSTLRYVKHSGSGTLTLLFIIDEEAKQFDEIEFLGISETLINRLETHLTSKITRESAHKHKRINELLDALPPDFDRRLLLTSEVRLLSLVLNDDETPELVLRAKFMSRDGIVVATDERFMFIHYSGKEGKELEVIASTYWDITSAKSKNNDLELRFVSTDTPAKFSGIAKDLTPIVVEVVNEKTFQHQQELYDMTAVLPGFDRELLRAILQQHEVEVLEKVVRASIENTDGILVATDHRLLFLFGSRKALQKHEFQWTKLRSVKRSGSDALTLLFIDEEAKRLTEIEFIGIAEALINMLEKHLISKVPTEHQSINEMLEDETPEKVVGASRGNTDGLLVVTNRYLFFLFDISDSVHSYKWHWTKLMSVNRSGSGALTLLFGSEEIRFDKISETLIDEFETFLISKIRRQSFTEESRTRSTSSVIREARDPIQSNSYSFTGIAISAIAAAFIVNYLFFNRSDDSISTKSDVLEYEEELLNYEISYVSDLVSEDVDMLEYERDSRDNEWNYAEDRESDDDGDAWDYKDREWDHEEDEDKERDYEEDEYRERE